MGKDLCLHKINAFLNLYKREIRADGNLRKGGMGCQVLLGLAAHLWPSVFVPWQPHLRDSLVKDLPLRSMKLLCSQDLITAGNEIRSSFQGEVTNAGPLSGAATKMSDGLLSNLESFSSGDSGCWIICVSVQV